MHYMISGCNDAGIDRIKDLEKENNLLLLAYRESEYDYDQITDADLDKVKSLESELGVKILALKKV